jgi:DNA ligase-associated metallophosphoesterase
MNGLSFTLGGQTLVALASGALFLPGAGLLCVSDLHLARSDRIARREGRLLPPYETRATLDRLATDIAATAPGRVICLGDSFDDPAGAGALDCGDARTLAALQAGRDWLWIAGNHDPGAAAPGGRHGTEAAVGDLVFRHAALALPPDGPGAEVSGHYHPKLALPGAAGARRCFVFDDRRLILPSYGAYTGGLRATAPELRSLFGARAFVILTGQRPVLAPLPAPSAARRRGSVPWRPGRTG